MDINANRKKGNKKETNKVKKGLKQTRKKEGKTNVPFTR